MTLPEVAETAAVEQDNWLPKLDVPDVIQQKVIPGKTEGGQVQHDPPQKKSWHPSSGGSLRASLQLVPAVWGGKGPCSSPRQGVSSGCCHPRGLMPRAACPHGQVEGHRSHPSCGARLDNAAESGERWVTGSAPPAAAPRARCCRGSSSSPRNKELFWITKPANRGGCVAPACKELRSLSPPLALEERSLHKGDALGSLRGVQHQREGRCSAGEHGGGRGCVFGGAEGKLGSLQSSPLARGSSAAWRLHLSLPLR